MLTIFMMALTMTNYILLNSNIDTMMKIEIKMDIFVREARALIDARYT